VAMAVQKAFQGSHCTGMSRDQLEIFRVVFNKKATKEGMLPFGRIPEVLRILGHSFSEEHLEEALQMLSVKLKPGQIDIKKINVVTVQAIDDDQIVLIQSLINRLAANNAYVRTSIQCIERESYPRHQELVVEQCPRTETDEWKKSEFSGIVLEVDDNFLMGGYTQLVERIQDTYEIAVGALSEENFLELMRWLVASPDMHSLDDAFDAFDENADQWVSIQELRHFLRSINNMHQDDNGAPDPAAPVDSTRRLDVDFWRRIGDYVKQQDNEQFASSEQLRLTRNGFIRMLLKGMMSKEADDDSLQIQT